MELGVLIRFLGKRSGPVVVDYLSESAYSAITRRELRAPSIDKLHTAQARSREKERLGIRR